MTGNRKKLIAALPLTALLLMILCTTVVRQGSLTIVMSFGRPVRVISEPGLYLRFPYPVNSVQKIDGRMIMLEPKPSEFLTSDKKNLILENSVCYSIKDPILFVKTVRDKKGLEIRLTDLLSSHTGRLLGVHALSDIVNVNPEKVQFSKINLELTELMKRDSVSLGIKVHQVFIKRIMLPYENRIAVYDRMRAERNRIAKKYIAEGEEIALKIRAEADRASRTILAKAKKESLIIKGRADAKAMKIYGSAYSINPAFYSFMRSLQAYDEMFNEKTVIILDEKSPILNKFFNGYAK